MAILSDSIEQFIKSLLEEYDEMIELQRNELANYFSCAPSQINYVLATRFSPEKGYYVESKRAAAIYQTGAYRYRSTRICFVAD